MQIRTRHVAIALMIPLVASACAGQYETVATTIPDEGSTAAAPPPAAAVSTDGVLRIGAVLPMTGDLEGLGPVALAGIELAVDDLNAAGGVLGNDVELRSADSGSTAAIGVDVAERLLADEAVDALLVDARGDGLADLLPIAEAAGVPICASGPAGAALEATADMPLLHRTTASPTLEVGVALAGLGDDVETIVVVHGDDDDSSAMADALDMAVSADDGGRTVTRVVLAVGGNQADVIGAVAEVVAAAPDAVLLAVDPAAGAALLLELVTAAYGPDAIEVVALGSMTSGSLPTLIDQAAAAAAPPTTTTTATTTTGNGAPATETTSRESAATTTTVGPDPEITASATERLRGVQLAPRFADQEFLDRLGLTASVAELAAAAELYDCTIALALAAQSAGTDAPRDIASMLPAVTSGGTSCRDAQSCLDLLEAGDDIDLSGVEGIELDPRGATTTGVVRRWIIRDDKLAFVDAVSAPLDTSP